MVIERLEYKGCYQTSGNNLKKAKMELLSIKTSISSHHLVQDISHLKIDEKLLTLFFFLQFVALALLIRFEHEFS